MDFFREIVMYKNNLPYYLKLFFISLYSIWSENPSLENMVFRMVGG